MTEKVKLTREQAEALELYKANTGKDLGWVQYFVEYRHCFNYEYLPLKGFTFDEFARVLYLPDSYEVEEEYKVGDWVVNTANSRIAKVEKDAPDRVWVDDEKARYFMKSALRHATPEEIKAEKERRVWKKIGREVGEFRDGDIAFTNKGSIWQSAQFNKESYKHGELKGFYPAESFISFGGGEE